MKKKIVFVLVLGLILAFCAWRVWHSVKSRHLEKQTRFVMDTYVTIYAQGFPEQAQSAINAAFTRIQQIDLKFNHLNPQSQLYAFNHGGAPISDPEVLNLIRIALEASCQTQGAFDITVTPLLELWGFYSGAYRVPSPVEIAGCLKNVGYHHLLWKDGQLTKDSAGVKIDLGGIAKGYAIIEAIKVLKSRGVTAAIVDAGGDVYALGAKNGKSLWKVGIKAPRGEGLLGYLEVADLAVIGSGDYERFFLKDGKRYHHIFNPHAGYPTEGVSGVTIIYNDPIIAQIWAKIPFVLGPRKGLEILKKNFPDMEAVIVTTEGKTIYSENLSHALKTIPKT